MHVPDQQRRKFDDKSQKYIFVGYDQASKGYMLYDPVEKKRRTSRDVVFDEKSSWDWNSHENEHYTFYPIEAANKEVEKEPVEPETPPPL